MPVELGVSLTVTPVTGGGKEIICATDVSVSNFLSPTTELLPTSVARRVSGTLRIRDGDSILVGGMVTRDDSDLVKSLPGLTRVEALTDLLGLDTRSRSSGETFFIIGARVLQPGARPDDSESKLLLEGDGRDREDTPDSVAAAGDMRSVSTRRGMG
jgi:type II secretory pathway component GspD/PulD (secretin)